MITCKMKMIFKTAAAAAAVAAEVIVGRGDGGMEGNRNRN